MKLANLMYITPPITASTYRQPLGRYKGHLLPSCKDSLRIGIMGGQVTGGNLPVWQRLVCPHKQRLWKTSSILSWMPHVAFEKGGEEDVMVLLPCWSVERIWFLHLCCSGTATEISSVGFVVCSPFPPGNVLLPQQRHSSHGDRHGRMTVQEKEQQCSLRWPEPGSAVMKAAGWSMSLLQHLPDRDDKSTLCDASTCKGQKAQLSQGTEHGHWGLPMLLTGVVSQSPSSLTQVNDGQLCCCCFGQIPAGTRKRRCFI